MPSRYLPGSGRCLQELSQAGVVLAMVSSDSESNVRRALGDYAALISQFACGASLFGKAAKFKAVLKRTGIAADDAIASAMRSVTARPRAGRDRFRGGVVGLCQARGAQAAFAGSGVRTAWRIFWDLFSGPPIAAVQAEVCSG